MLADLERRLVDLLTATPLDAVPVVAGPWPGPAESATEALSVHAVGLGIPGGDVAARESARIEELHTFAADGERTAFAVPDDARGDVHEVEAPGGHPVRAGDAYVLDGRAVRFYQPPAAGDVVVTLRGAPARGFDERRPAQIALAITAWATAAARADQLLDHALGVVLPAIDDLGTLGPRRLAGSPATLRLRSPQAHLDAIDRAVRTVGTRALITAQATLAIRGELQLAVVLAEARPLTRIETLIYRTTAPTARRR